MENKMYLIHEDDYIKHIDEKMILYTMLKDLIRSIYKLPSNRGNKTLSDLATKAEIAADGGFRTWGIPASYVRSFNRNHLAFLMESELIEPEDAGYFACDGECCGNCECCYESEDCDEEEPNEDEDFAEMMRALSPLIHSIFGENVSVHIVVE